MTAPSKRAMQHITRRKYIQQSLRYYGRNPSIDVRRLRRVLGNAYDDMTAGRLHLF